MDNYFYQGGPADIYNSSDVGCQPSLSINTSYGQGVPLEPSSSQSSHGTAGSHESDPSDFSSPGFDFNSPVDPFGNPYLLQDPTLQTFKSKTGLSRPSKMASGYRNNGSVSPTGGQLHHCLAGGGCNYRTDRHTDLKRHYKAKHSCPPEELFQCSYKSCTKEFKRKDHLRDHCKRVHYRDLPVEVGGSGRRLSR